MKTLPRLSRARRAFRNLIPTFDRYRRPRLRFPRSDKVRVSSYPFISGDTFRRICDHIFDETDVKFDPAAVEVGDLVFVNGSFLRQFFLYAHPRITEQYVLVTHNSDDSVPGAYAEFLDDSRIGAWFTQNPDRIHSKLHPLPIGLANGHWEHGNIAEIRSLIDQEDSESRKLLYMNFSRKRPGAERAEVWNLFREAEFCHIAEARSYREYLRDIQRSRFVISPPGVGLDCHRHWEALLLGSIPVMKHSSIDNLFADLPVVLVSDWKEINRDFLIRKSKELQDEMFDRERLFADFWMSQLKKSREDIRSPGSVK